MSSKGFHDDGSMCQDPGCALNHKWLQELLDVSPPSTSMPGLALSLDDMPPPPGSQEALRRLIETDERFLNAIDPKRTPKDWCAIKGVRIADIDGWRRALRLPNGRSYDAKSWDEPIREQEFNDRASASTLLSMQKPKVAVDDPMPVFTIKAQDALAGHALMAYLVACNEFGLTEQAEQVQLAIQEFIDWQRRNQNRIKYPDHTHIPATETHNG